MSLIGIGLGGAGWMGATLLRRFSEHEGVQVIGVHQRRRDKALEVMNELGIGEDLYFDDFEIPTDAARVHGWSKETLLGLHISERLTFKEAWIELYNTTKFKTIETTNKEIKKKLNFFKI